MLLVSGAIAVEGTALLARELRSALAGTVPEPVLERASGFTTTPGISVAAAARDHRFPPVRPEELPGLDVEVTVLSPLEPVADLKEVRIGTHGLYLEAAGTSSVFLPQVPVEQGWDLPTYLRELALKAGLPPDGWQQGRLSRFTADIIH